MLIFESETDSNSLLKLRTCDEFIRVKSGSGPVRRVQFRSNQIFSAIVYEDILVAKGAENRLMSFAVRGRFVKSFARTLKRSNWRSRRAISIKPREVREVLAHSYAEAGKFPLAHSCGLRSCLQG